jgi:hypothetical protein
VLAKRWRVHHLPSKCVLSKRHWLLLRDAIQGTVELHFLGASSHITENLDSCRNGWLHNGPALGTSLRYPQSQKCHQLLLAGQLGVLLPHWVCPVSPHQLLKRIGQRAEQPGRSDNILYT